MKKNILFALISLFVFGRVQRDEIKPYQGEQYLYFESIDKYDK